ADFLHLPGSPPWRRTVKIVPFEEDDAPYRRDHSPAGGRILRGMRSLGPTAVSASSITLFLGLGESSSGPRCTSTDIGFLSSPRSFLPALQPALPAMSSGTRSWPQAPGPTGS